MIREWMIITVFCVLAGSFSINLIANAMLVWTDMQINQQYLELGPVEFYP